ncbi:MAG: hypothetical protein DMG13_16280 [Acidobacteria bacterium]|nr:MAG: hypothetical protein DMG13_16280 [Acidobacteriota bacterium]
MKILRRLTRKLPIRAILAIALVALFSPAVLRAADTIPPSVPTNLIATVATCGQVNLSWNASTDEAGGSGLKAYLIHRSDWVETTIGAVRTTFSDTNYVSSSTTLTYTVMAIDYSGNRSAASNAVTVITPACPISAGEQVVGAAYDEPLGKAIATYGARTALLHRKMNAQMTLDTWAYVRDEDTGQTSRFLLHAYPGYYQTETDYVFTSATELWTLSYDSSFNGGHVLASQYKLSGSPIPTSATLISTKPLGDSNSRAMSMIRLQSGALMMAWNEQTFSYRVGDLTTGYAYRSPSGNWAVQFPVTFPSSYGIVLSSMVLAQHPADRSIWAFIKRDSYSEISALHFTEGSNSVVLNWMTTDYISQVVDGANGPEGEFPFLAAAPDPTRNVILLAYESNHDQTVFVDSLYGSMNSVFLKQTYATVAQIRADGTKTFIPFETYLERCSQFGMSVAADGTIWLTYQPINSSTLIWNEVYTRSYFSNTWSAPALIGLNYNNYNIASGVRDPGFIVYRTDQPQVAFLTPDQQVHSFKLSGSASPPSDSVPPIASITNPPDGATVSGVLSVDLTASDNTGVAQVDLVVDGVVKSSKVAAPYTFLWDTGTSAGGRHTLQAVARDIAGNVGYSTVVTVTIPDISTPVVAITSPVSGMVLARGTTASVTATATSSVGVTKVEFYVGSGLLGTTTSAPYTVPWNVPNRNNASYTIKAIAYDATGRTASATITVTAK